MQTGWNSAFLAHWLARPPAREAFPPSLFIIGLSRVIFLVLILLTLIWFIAPVFLTLISSVPHLLLDLSCSKAILDSAWLLTNDIFVSMFFFGPSRDFDQNNVSYHLMSVTIGLTLFSPICFFSPAARRLKWLPHRVWDQKFRLRTYGPSVRPGKTYLAAF